MILTKFDYMTLISYLSLDFLFDNLTTERKKGKRKIERKQKEKDEKKEKKGKMELNNFRLNNITMTVLCLLNS